VYHGLLDVRAVALRISCHRICNTGLCCAVLCCAVLCCALLCCAVLCCAVSAGNVDHHSARVVPHRCEGGWHHDAVGCG
jgi:hypothetical protein